MHNWLGFSTPKIWLVLLFSTCVCNCLIYLFILSLGLTYYWWLFVFVFEKYSKKASLFFKNWKKKRKKKEDQFRFLAFERPIAVYGWLSYNWGRHHLRKFTCRLKLKKNIDRWIFWNINFLNSISIYIKNNNNNHCSILNLWKWSPMSDQKV